MSVCCNTECAKWYNFPNTGIPLFNLLKEFVIFRLARVGRLYGSVRDDFWRPQPLENKEANRILSEMVTPDPHQSMSAFRPPFSSYPTFGGLRGKFNAAKIAGHYEFRKL